MDIFIIGTGVFGLSTAIHVRQRLPNARLSIFSRPCSLAPSDDISKIVRVDYPSSVRTVEAAESQRQWDQVFPDYLQRIGRIVISEKEDHIFHDINSSRKLLGMGERVRHGREIMEKMFGTSNAPDSLVYGFNSDDGIVDWERCISQQREEAKKFCQDSGGTFHESGVNCLDHDGLVTTIILEDGQRIEAAAAEVVLAVGPWFTEILDKSGIPLPPQDRIPVPTGIFSFTLRLSDEQARFFEGKPMVSHYRTAEFLPPVRGSNIGKLTWIEPFTNIAASSLSRSGVEDLSGSHLARAHMAKAIRWAREFIPALKGGSIISIMSFWDGVTQTQIPILARHPDLQNLICSTGGSFNRAKDLPTIGAHVVNLLMKQPIPDRYSWSTEGHLSHTEHPGLVSRGAFVAMEEAARELLKDQGSMGGDQFFPITI